MPADNRGWHGHNLGIRIATTIALAGFALAVSLSGPAAPTAANPGWELILDRPKPDFQAIEFVSDNEGWLVTSTGLLLTTDGGETWEEAVRMGGRDIDFADPEHGWLVGIDGGIYATVDGATWSAQTSGTFVHLSDVQAVSAQEAWAVGSGAGFSDAITFPPRSTFLHTIDGGTTWQEVETPANTWFREVTFVGEHGWAVGSQSCPPEPATPPPGCPGPIAASALLHTADGGATWTLLEADLPDLLHSLEFVDETHGSAIGRACEPEPCRDVLLKTADGGVTWQQIPWPFGSFLALTFQDELTGWAVVEDCKPAGVTCNLMLFSTIDGGMSWSVESISPPHRGSLSLLVNDAAMYVIGDGLALRSTDGGADWIRMEHPAVSINTLDFIDERAGYAGSSGAILRTSDSGRNWTDVGAPPSERAPLLEFVDADRGFAAAQVCVPGHCSLAVHLTEDGGASWTQVLLAPDVRSTFPRDLTFVDALHGWVVTASDIFITSDGGATWEDADPDDTGGAFPVVLVDAEHAWGVIGGGAGPRLGRSTDGGRTWEFVRELGGERYDPLISFVDDEHGWYTQRVCEEECFFNVVTTENGGETWRTSRLGLTNVVDLVFVDRWNGWVIGYRCDDTGCGPNTILHTADGGVTWAPQASGEPFLGKLTFSDVEHGWLPSVTARSLGLGGGPPTRTLLYHTSDAGGGPIGLEPPTPTIQFPIVGAAATESNQPTALSLALLLAAFGTALAATAVVAFRRRLR